MKSKDYIIFAGLGISLFMSVTLIVKDRNITIPYVNDEENTKFESLAIPDEIDFAGEKVPLHKYDVAERLDKEIHINAYWASNTILVMKRINRWFPMIEKILKEQGIPDDFKYLAVAETMLQNVESPAGAAGFWQLLPETAKELGLIVNDEIDERNDPEKSTRAACKYIKKAKKQFGTWTDAAASYNRGTSGYERALKNQKVKHFYDLKLNDETGRYVFRVLAFKEILENSKKYGFKYQKNQGYKEMEKTHSVKIDTTINSLPLFAQQNGITYKTLRAHNPWLNSDRLTNKEGKTYTFQIPEEKDWVESDSISEK